MATATSTSTAASRSRASAVALPRGLFARACILLAGAALATLVTIKGLAVRAAVSDPQAAALLAPYDARAAIASARAEVKAGGNVASPTVKRLVGQALARDATLTSAIEIRALEAEAARQPDRAGRLFELSSAISRRSLPTRLWLIQRSVNRGDVAGALANFDIALRTSSDAPEVLYPVLASASSDPGLSLPLARLLDRPSEWREGFLHYAITEAHAGPGVTGVLMHMADRRLIVGKQIDQALMGELLSEKAFALAKQVRGAFGPPSGAGLVADPHFADARQPYPFGWLLIDSGPGDAQRVRSGGKTALEYQATPGGGGAVATQLLTLPPGGYRLTVTTAAPANDRTSQPFWTLTCGDAGGQIAVLDQPGTAEASAGEDFTVPQGCTGQWLALNLKTSDEPNLVGSIRSVEVTRR